MSMGILTHEDFARLAEARCGMYRFLASIFLEKPTFEFVSRIQSGDLQKSLSSLIPPPDVPSEFKEGLETIRNFSNSHQDQRLEELHHDIAAEWTRLFRGVAAGYSPPPPYESVYEGGGRLLDEHTIDVITDYTKEMVEVAKPLGEAPDYIGVELEFTSLLCERETQAWTKKDRRTATKYLGMENQFLSRHPAKWFPKFCREVIREARPDLFKGLILIINALIIWDHNNTERLLEAADNLS